MANTKYYGTGRRKIISKYPDIAKATDEIKNITEKNPQIKKAELREKIQPILDRIGKEIDITI